ncbi:MAG: type III pantothenate kinase [Candidatus Humimicrobiaceae bacterium]
MLLAVDIGNTQTVIGLFKGSRLYSSWRMVTPKYETSDEIAASIFNFMKNCGYRPSEVKKVAVSCVVPRILEEIQAMSKRYFKRRPFIVDSNMKIGMDVRYDYPNEIGADRIANSVAAKEIYGCPAIVVDFGTATTFDIVSSDGNYIGGVIAPGIEISSEALFSYAAKLSKVDLNWTKNIIGKNTYDGIRSGIMYGFLGQVDFLIEKIIEEEKDSNSFNPKIIATGGLSYLMKEKSKWIQVDDPDLTLKGLQILYKKNN